MVILSSCGGEDSILGSCFGGGGEKDLLGCRCCWGILWEGRCCPFCGAFFLAVEGDGFRGNGGGGLFLTVFFASIFFLMSLNLDR